MQISVVTTMYRSAPVLREFHARMTASVRALTDDYELLFVNDGSPDDALAVALALQREDAHVKVIDLSRNFGHHQAIMTGLRYARGASVFLIDCDLEEDPEVLPRFREMQEKTGADVVYGVQDSRRGGVVERWSGWLYYKFLNTLSKDPLPVNLLTVRLMSRRYLDCLLQHEEVELNIAGLWVRTGFCQVPMALNKKRTQPSNYNLARKLSLLVNGVTSMSSQPLVFVFYLGCVISMIAGLAAGVLIIRQLFFGALMQGWPSTIVSIWLLGGMIIFCQGVLGIYLSKVVMETKRRPITIVRHVYERPEPTNNGAVEFRVGPESHPAETP